MEITIPPSFRSAAACLAEESVSFDLTHSRIIENFLSISDASLLARQIVLKKGNKTAHAQALARVPNIQDFQILPSDMSVLSYKLILLPFWIANYRHEENVYTIVINGQTKRVSGQKPSGLFKKLFGSIFD